MDPWYQFECLLRSICALSALNIHPNAGGFVIGAGAVLGISAGLLWAAQGSLMLAYPTEDQKGQFISIFWTIFNLGAVIGAAVSLGLNFNSDGNSVGNGTYVRFLANTVVWNHANIKYLDRVPYLDWYWGSHSVAYGRPHENGADGRHEGYHFPSPFLEVRTLRPLPRAKERPMDLPPRPHVLCL